MKKLTFLFICLIFAISSFAQESEDQEIQTLFGKGIRISGFGGPFMSFTTINGEFAHMMGGGGGILLDDFFFGGYGEGLTNYITVPGGDKIEFGHGGFWIGYSFLATKVIHPAISSQIGWGGLSLIDPDNQETTYEDNVLVVNPNIECELNMTKFLRLSLGIHYRFVTGVNAPELTFSEMSGPGVFLAFKFGGF